MTLRRFIFLVAAALATMPATVSAAPPPNDAFAAATVQSGPWWMATGTLHGATSEGNEPIVSGFPNGPTAWWRWTAPSTGNFRLRTWGSEETTLLAVWRGATLDSTRLVTFASGHFGRGNSAEVTFAATAGTTYSIQVLGADWASPTFVEDAFLPSRLLLTLAPAAGNGFVPANDAFANAQVLTGATADVLTCNSGASAEPGEPPSLPGALGNSVWLAWTAPTGGTWQLDAQQSGFDNIVAIYSGGAVAALTRVDAADTAFAVDADPNPGGGRVVFTAAVGVTYRIQVVGASTGGPVEHGVVRLKLQPAQPPANDAFANAETLAGTSPTGEAWTTFATRELAEPAAEPDESRSVWWKWTAPVTGSLAVIQNEGTVAPWTGASLATLAPLPTDPRSGTSHTLGAVTYRYLVTAGTTVWLRGTAEDDRVIFSLRTTVWAPNDDFANRALLTGPTATGTVDLLACSWENGEPTTDGLGPATAWWTWTAPSTGKWVIDTAGSTDFTRVNVFTGNSLASLVEVGEERLRGFAPDVHGRVLLDAVAGTPYAIQLRRETITPGLRRVNVQPLVPPANDAFAAATTVNGSAWSTTGNNVNGTIEPNEPIPLLSESSSLASVWWKWTAPASGLYRATTAGSGINTVFAVFTGAALGGLTKVAESQSGAWNSAGTATFAATAGTTYHFMVDGQAREEGALKLALGPVTAPPNNAFAARVGMTGLNTSFAGTVLGATAEAGEPVLSPTTSGRSVWHEWTAPATGTALFRVVAPRFNPLVGIYSGSALGGLTPFVSGGSGLATTTEQTFLIGYPVSSGVSYKILVDGAPTDNGSYRLSVTLAAPPVNDAIASRVRLTGAIVHSSASNEGATREPNEPAHAGSTANGSVWWEWTAPAAGPVSMDMAGSTGQARLAVYTGSALNALTAVASDVISGLETYPSLTFTATAGTVYHIAADSSDRGRGELALNIVSGSAAPPNDAFASATPWVGDQHEALVEMHGATAEANEPAHGGRAAARSVWWAWTPSTSRRATLWMETQHASLQARLVLYRGSALNSLTPVAAQTSDGHWTRLEADVLAGETYRLVLDTPAVAVDPGWIKVGIVPLNGRADSPASIRPEDGVVSADTTGAIAASPAVAPTSTRELWWAWSTDVCARMEWRVFAAADSGAVVSVVEGTSLASRVVSSSRAVPGAGQTITTFDTVPDAIYVLKVATPVAGPVRVQLVEAPRQPPPPNDRRHLALPMSGGSWSVPVTLGAEPDGVQWWTWTATQTGVAEISLAGLLAEDDAVFAHADGGGVVTTGASSTNGGAPVLRIASKPGQRWAISTRSALKRVRGATLSLASPAPGTPPPNDAWENATALGSQWSTVLGSVLFASCQADEPDHSASGGTNVATKLPPGRSVWYDWTPAVTGPVTLRLASAAPLALRLYRGGPTRDEWYEDAWLMPDAATLTATVFAGERYHIAVATRPYHEQTGTFVLSLGAAASNDLLANAIALSGATATSTVNSAGAGTEAGEPGYGFNFETPRASLWWKWTAPATGSVWIDTLGSDFDTVLTVFGSDPPDTSNRLGENDNATTRAGVGASALRLAVTAGQTLTLRVTRRDAAEPTGQARLNVSMTAPADPYARWIASFPTLTGPAAAETADPDGDGVPNLVEMAFGTHPQQPSSVPTLRAARDTHGWTVEAALDRDAMEAATDGTPLDVRWELSTDLRTWRQGPPGEYVRREGRLAVERIALSPSDPPYARLRVRRLR